MTAKLQNTTTQYHLTKLQNNTIQYNFPHNNAIFCLIMILSSHNPLINFYNRKLDVIPFINCYPLSPPTFLWIKFSYASCNLNCPAQRPCKTMVFKKDVSLTFYYLVCLNFFFDVKHKKISLYRCMQHWEVYLSSRIYVCLSLLYLCILSIFNFSSTSSWRKMLKSKYEYLQKI